MSRETETTETEKICLWFDDKGPTPESVKKGEKGTLVPAAPDGDTSTSKWDIIRPELAGDADQETSTRPKRGKSIRKLFNIKTTKGKRYE